MDRNKKNISDNRSDKVRELLDEKPSILIRYGTIFIILVFIFLFYLVLKMPYPNSEKESILSHILAAITNK